MSGDKNDLPQSASVREAAIRLLADLDAKTARVGAVANLEVRVVGELGDKRVFASIEGLRDALQSERSAGSLAVDIDQALGAIGAMKRGEPILPEDIHAIVALAEAGAEHVVSFRLRWDADMRAIKRWQEAGEGRDLIWPDHADLVVWLLELIELRPACPSIDDVNRMIRELDSRADSISGPVTPLREAAASMIGQLARALVASSQRTVIAEAMTRFAPAGFAAGGYVTRAPDLNGHVPALLSEPVGVRFCRVCKCTETTACRVVDTENDRPCGWAGPSLCDNPSCIEHERVRLNRAIAAVMINRDGPISRSEEAGEIVESIAPGWTYRVSGDGRSIELGRYCPNEPL